MNLRDIRFAVIDIESTGIDRYKDKIVEIGILTMSINGPKNIWSTLIDPEIPIPARASMIHHITDKDVFTARTFNDCAYEIRDLVGDAIIVAHNASFDKAFLPILHTNEWMCSMQCAKKTWPGLPLYKNQFFRYHLNMDIDPNIPAHRVDLDITVTSKLWIAILKKYMKTCGEGKDTIEEFRKWYDIKSLLSKMPFGKHKDEPFKLVPTSYLTYCLKNWSDIDPSLKYTMESEIKNRMK